MGDPWPTPTLAGSRVRLEAMTIALVDELVAAASEDRTTYDLTTVPPDDASMRRHVDGLVDEWRRGEAVPFVQREVTTGRVVGATRYLNIRTSQGRATPYAVEVGGTWLAASAQGTGVNAESKLLLLGYAFDVWRVARVDFKTDARNERSRGALAGIGATFEGVLRQWQPSLARGEEGLFRDSAMYSVVASEWPRVRAALGARLGGVA